MALTFCAVDACYPLEKQENSGVSTRCIQWMLKKHNLQQDNIGSASAILVSCQFPTQANFVARLKKKYPRRLVVVGGSASTSPCSFEGAADAVVIGNGERFIEALSIGGIDRALELDNVWRPGSKACSVDSTFPWDMPPAETELHQWQVNLGRGCKKKCAFCQTGWAFEYSENPSPDILLRQIKSLQSKKKRVNFVTNDPLQHKFAHLLPKVDSQSYSFDFIRKRGLPSARQVRMGVEGPSERLRRLVGKPISHDDLCKMLVWLTKNKKSLRVFLVAGLPSETDADWLELRDVAQYWIKNTDKGAMEFSFTAWCPTPATPLRSFPLNDGYVERWKSFRSWFIGGPGWSNRLPLMQPAGATTRLESAQMCMTESAAALYRGSHGPNATAVNFPYASRRDRAEIRIRETINGSVTQADRGPQA
jgi:hypothetical protein